MVTMMSAEDAECGSKGTCDCGEAFGHFLGLYLIAIICHTVYRIKYYCRSVVRDVTRRELKVGMRQAVMVFCSIFTVLYGLMLYGWHRDTVRDEC